MTEQRVYASILETCIHLISGHSGSRARPVDRSRGKLAPSKATTALHHHNAHRSLPFPHLPPIASIHPLSSNLKSLTFSIVVLPRYRFYLVPSVEMYPTGSTGRPGCSCRLVISITHPRSRLSGSPLARIGGIASLNATLLASRWHPTIRS